MARKPRLELVWIDKEHRPRLEPRVLIEDRTQGWRGRKGLTDNRLIFGDNLLALKALEQEFTGKVKCCFIDPPYNTGGAFAHYEDGLEHSRWLSLMRDRLEIIRRLLADDGSLWISIDDNEAHYLKVMCDEIFGRSNFVANVVWQKRTSPDARLRLGGAHDHVLVFARDAAKLALNRLAPPPGRTGPRNPDDDPRGPWTSTDFTAQGWRPNQMYRIVAPAGQSFDPPPGRCWANVEPVFRELVADGRIWFGKRGQSRPRVKTFLSESGGRSAWSWWEHNAVGHNQEAKKESIALFGAGNAFATPKPERLVQRILEIATGPGDLVLDSFAGSGTTGAVAHKMGRRWIMVELGEHCRTHIMPRLRKVIDGEDAGGVTEATDWKGGGGFRYYSVGPSLLAVDRHGRRVVSHAHTAATMIEAVCKLEGFTYEPSETVWWQHGRANEQAFIYVTAATLAHDELARLSDEVGESRTLLVFCRAFRSAATYPNLVLRKLPNALWNRCDWSRDDYSMALVAAE